MLLKFIKSEFPFINLFMGNILDEYEKTNNIKSEIIEKHKIFIESKRTHLGKLFHYICYNYKLCKYYMEINFHLKLFEIFSVFNPKFKRQNKPKNDNNLSPHISVIHDNEINTQKDKNINKNEEIQSDKLEIEFNEEERDPADFKDIALYMKKDPKYIFKDENLKSNLHFHLIINIFSSKKFARY